ncbi:DUF488 domain-containing protein [Lentisalinibacter sediminis]|uniref:DUF488 domain-containing protein n=1 Tax=Lentisalinibacter sediminis TaxID=2992237 RepID=UPI00386AF272
MRKLCTIGYEGADIEQFVRTLQRARITVLVDVREFPISRRKGFSKNALRSRLEDLGIGYHHEKALGSPKELRHQLRKDWDYDYFFREYEKHLSKQSTLIDRLCGDLRGNVALMCYERHAGECHRSSVAAAISDRLEKDPVHLIVETANGRTKRDTDDSHLSQGFSTA